MIGTRYGRKQFAVEAGTKSLEGVAMFFLVTWIVAMVLLLLMTDIGRINVVLLSRDGRGLRCAGRGRLLARLRQPVRARRHPSVSRRATWRRRRSLLLLLTGSFIATLCAILRSRPSSASPGTRRAPTRC